MLDNEGYQVNGPGQLVNAMAVVYCVLEYFILFPSLVYCA